MVITWWVACGLLILLGVPIASVVFARFHDHGAGLSLPVSLGLLLLLVYWLGRIHYSFGIIIACLGGIAGISVVCYKFGEYNSSRVIESIGVFSLGYLFVVGTRSLQPSIRPAGGEKFLDYGLLNTIIRSTSLPPMDLWFAGEPVQYYYGGHLLSATLSIVTGTPPRYAYNLALAGFFGALLMAVYSFTGSIVHSRGGSYRLGGGLGVFFVGFASNLVTPVQTVISFLPLSLASSVAHWLGAVTAVEPAWFLALREPINVYFYWTASRVIPGTINEFPLFAWINGDLHAHMMSLPFLVLAISLIYSTYTYPDSHLVSNRVRLFGVLPIVTGLLAVINTWDVPTVLGITWLASYFATHPAETPLTEQQLSLTVLSDTLRTELTTIRTASFNTLVVLGVAIIWVFPFVIGPALGGSGRGIGWFPARSWIVPFVLVWGWFFLIFGVYLWKSHRDKTLVTIPRILGISGVVLLGYATNTLVPIVLLLLIGITWISLRTHTQFGFDLILVLAGTGLLFLVEFVFLQEQAGPERMNTVFKIYMHTWVLWAMASGIILATLYETVPSSTASRLVSRTGIQAIIMSSVLLLSLYGFIAVGGLVATANQPSLDATDWAATTHSTEWEAIEWLDEQPGQPHIVSLPGCSCHPDPAFHPYRWVNAPSSFTGIPTVAGWSHEIGYRSEDQYLTRVQDVNTIYTGTEQERLRLLTQYDVTYIWVGPNERSFYSNPTFDGPQYQIVFNNSAVTIYRIDHPTRT